MERARPTGLWTRSKKGRFDCPRLLRTRPAHCHALRHRGKSHHLFSVIALTLLIWIVSGFATFSKSEWQIRMDVEDEKREEEMRKIREQRNNR